MLIYHPAFDMYHCVFRIVRILLSLPVAEYETERVRIFDFYSLFPYLLNDIRAPRNATSDRKKFGALENSYEKVEDKKRFFLSLEPYQDSAIKSLASYEIIDSAALRNSRILLIPTNIPPALTVSAKNSDKRFSKDLEFFRDYLLDIELTGDTGLKQRTGLFEYRYDVIAA